MTNPPTVRHVVDPCGLFAIQHFGHRRLALIDFVSPNASWKSSGISFINQWSDEQVSPATSVSFPVSLSWVTGFLLQTLVAVLSTSANLRVIQNGLNNSQDCQVLERLKRLKIDLISYELAEHLKTFRCFCIRIDVCFMSLRKNLLVYLRIFAFIWKPFSKLVRWFDYTWKFRHKL